MNEFEKDEFKDELNEATDFNRENTGEQPNAENLQDNGAETAAGQKQDAEYKQEAVNQEGERSNMEQGARQYAGNGQNTGARQSTGAAQGSPYAHNTGYRQNTGYQQSWGYQQGGYQQGPGYQQGSGYQQDSGYQQGGYRQGSGYGQNSPYGQNTGYWQNTGYQRDAGYQQNAGYQQSTGYQQNRRYYNENYKENKKSGIGLKHLIIVALVCSILGGAFVFALNQIAAPALQSSLGDAFGWNRQGNNTNPTTAPQSTTPRETYAPIVIEGADLLNAPVVSVAQKVTPSIVGINIKSTYRSWFGIQEVEGGGSGIILTEDGLIMTNNHVIQDAMSSSRGLELVSGASITVIVESNEEQPYAAKVIGRDPATDLALLKIEATGLTPAELGDSDKVRQGETAIAIGNPGGFDSTVTVGVISGLDRTLVVQGKQQTLIQTDAAINPGNSGGALVNIHGEVIGVNSVKVSAVDYEGMGFAIPINLAKSITDSLLEDGYVKNRPSIGVGITEVFDSQYQPIGLRVDEVFPDSAAFRAGIKEGDVIKGFNEVTVNSYADLELEKSKFSPGDKVKIEVLRDGKLITLELTLGEDKG